MTNRKVQVFRDEEEILKTLCEQLETAAKKAILANNNFTIGLSGASLVKLTAKGFPRISTDWSKWKFFFCDERVVPFDSEDSTFGAYKKAFANVVDVKDEQFVTVDPTLNAEDAAKDYVKKLTAYFPPNELPRFDVLLLGVGPDGHTCSLFPNHALLAECSVWVAPITDSPKPPPSRITLTFPVINNAQLCIFVVVGEGKAFIIKRILGDNEPLPAGLVSPTNGEVHWHLDAPAASQLKQ